MSADDEKTPALWCDFDEIYNGSSSTTGSKPRRRVPLENTCTAVPPETNPNPHAMICSLDDFPFLRRPIYAECTSKPKRAPVIKRSYEEAFMIEGVGATGCSNGDRCECARMFGFTMRTFCMPDGTDYAGLCLLCIRINVLGLYLDAKKNSIIPQRPIQPYRNIIGVRGEYSDKDCIALDDAHRIEPFVLHVSHKYDVSHINGIRRVVQNGYGDFTEPPQ